MASIAELMEQLAATPEGVDLKKKTYAEDINGLLKQASAAITQLQSIAAQLVNVADEAEAAGCSADTVACARDAAARISADLAQGIIAEA